MQKIEIIEINEENDTNVKVIESKKPMIEVVKEEETKTKPETKFTSFAKSHDLDLKPIESEINYSSVNSKGQRELKNNTKKPKTSVQFSTAWKNFSRIGPVSHQLKLLGLAAHCSKKHNFSLT